MPLFLGVCRNKDDGRNDTNGNDCDKYDLSNCGIHDDDDFKADDMCCVCGGGDISISNHSYFHFSY